MGSGKASAEGIRRYIVKSFREDPLVMTAETAGSQRAVGDAIATRIRQRVAERFSAVEPRSHEDSRAMADFYFKNAVAETYHVNVITRRKSATLNQPNITSIRRLAALYQKRTDVFALMLVSYTVKNRGVVVSKVQLFRIEHLSWFNLSIGALGWGQLQLKGLDDLDVCTSRERKDWLRTFAVEVDHFYLSQHSRVMEQRKIVLKMLEEEEKTP